MTETETSLQNVDAPPAPGSCSSDVDTLLAHQNVIANTHPEGSYFMTNEGHYVQLVNGVLTHVEFQPSPPPSIQYTPVQFMDQAGYNYHQTQSLPQQQQQQQQQHFQQQQVPIVQMQPQSLPQQQQHFEPGNGKSRHKEKYPQGSKKRRRQRDRRRFSL